MELKSGSICGRFLCGVNVGYHLMDAFCVASVSDNWLVDKAGVAFLQNICISFGVKSVRLTRNLSTRGAIFRA